MLAILSPAQTGPRALKAARERGDRRQEFARWLVRKGNAAGGDVFSRLLTFPNVVITGHQAFFTAEALANIAETTLANLTDLERTGASGNEVTPPTP